MSERWNEMDDADLSGLENEMRGELEELREAATVYADRAWARGTGVAMERSLAQRSFVRRGPLAWAAASVVAAAALTIGGVRLTHRTAPVTAHGDAVPMTVDKGSPVSDEALLEQIQSDLSSGVPAAMEPLQASSDMRGVQNVVKR